jgi:hypothetical protein
MNHVVASLDFRVSAWLFDFICLELLLRGGRKVPELVRGGIMGS